MSYVTFAKYPKMLYKGKASKIVENEIEEGEAVKKGFIPYGTKPEKKVPKKKNTKTKEK